MTNSKIEISDEEIREAFDQRVESGIPEDADFEDLKEGIKEEITNQKVSLELQTLIQELRENADVRTWLEY